MRKLFTLILLGFTLVAQPQDTLKILQYNLLNYGNYTSYCTSENNNHENKDPWIRTIISHELPDIFTVNELSSIGFYHDRILNSVLNADGRTGYRRGTISNTAGSDLVNMLYYNSDKLVLKSSGVVQSYVRDIDLFTLYCKTAELNQGDTVFLHCIVAHLKSGNDATNAGIRAIMTQNAITYLKEFAEPGNYLFMGDLNTYKSSEVCYQNLTDLSALDFRFFDPVNKPGDWNNNGAFAAWHTQSVTATSNGCQASGGADDRFDHILSSAELMNGTRGLKYVTDSYHAVGQDGLHFNKSLTDPPENTSVPSDVLTALFSNSDHLPVRLDLMLTSGNPGSISEQSIFRSAGISLLNPHRAGLFVTLPADIRTTVSIISLTGQIVQSARHQLVKGRNEINMDISGIGHGVYIIRLSDPSGQTASLKLVK